MVGSVIPVEQGLDDVLERSFLDGNVGHGTVGENLLASRNDFVARHMQSDDAGVVGLGDAVRGPPSGEGVGGGLEAHDALAHADGGLETTEAAVVNLRAFV